MKKVLYSVGIDIAKDKFDVCFKELKSDGRVVIKGSRIFTNDSCGFKGFLAWCIKRICEVENALFVMEATGVYYEKLAYYLYEQGMCVCVELANKVKHYGKSLNVKTKTDKVDASVLAQMGLERTLKAWQPMSPIYRQLRDLSRLKLSYKKDLNALKNQLSAMVSAHEKYDVVLSLHKEQIAFYQASIAKLDAEIEGVAKQDPALYQRLQKVCTIKGVQFNTIVAIVCETNGFALFENIRQVVSYAGLDVKFNESGKYKGKTSISKKGNSRIRAVLYMPTLSAIQYNKSIAGLHERICENNPTTKMKGVVAAMRKLLVLIYVLWEKNDVYDENYQWGKTV